MKQGICPGQFRWPAEQPDYWRIVLYDRGARFFLR